MEERNNTHSELQFALMKEMLSFNEACAYLNLSSSWLYKLTHSNRIPHYKPNGKKIYFKKEELIEWLSRNAVKTIEQITKESLEYVQGKPFQKKQPFLKKLKEMKQ